MEKQLKDYLHLYIGATVVFKKYSHEFSKMGWCIGEKYALTGTKLGYIERECYDHSDIEIHLRPLSEITAQELNKLEDLLPPDESIDEEDMEAMLPHGAEATRYLLSCGFDLFHLIRDGLAIDKSKPQPHDLNKTGAGCD